jgi:hypothetical protein
MKPTKVILTSIGRGGPTEVKQLNPNHALVPWLPLHSPRSSHAPRRSAANLTGSRAAPPGRRPHQLTRRAAQPPSSPAHTPRRPRRPPAHLSSLSGHWSPTPGPCNANARPPRPPTALGLCLHREGEVQPPLRSPTTNDCHAQVSSSPLPRGRFGERFFFAKEIWRPQWQ